MDELLERAVKEIRGQELKILDDFAKAYLAGVAITSPSDIAWLIKNLQLNQQQTYEDGKIGYKYWYSYIDREGE